MTSFDVVLSNIFEIGDFLYGGRAVVYALLAASDPVAVPFPFVSPSTKISSF